MREFSKFEQQIIKYIVASRWGIEVNEIDAKPLDTGALISRHMNALAVSVNTVNNQFYVHAKENRAGNNELLKVDLNEIFDIIGLLRYLDREYLVDFYELKEFKDKEAENTENDTKKTIFFFWSRTKYEVKGKTASELTYGDILIEKQTKIEHRINQGQYMYIDFGDIFMHYANTIFYPNEALRDLVKNDFKSAEKRRFEEQLKDADTKHKETMQTANDQIKEAKKQTINSRRALYVSWGALGVSIIATIWTICSSSNTIRDIEQIIHNNKLTLPEVIETKITNDTIKVDVVKPTPIKKK